MKVHVSTDVSAVTVYPDRARVTRSGAVALEPGFSRLEVTELPQSLNPDSVRAAGRGAAPIRLLGVDVRPDYYVETPAARVRELQQQVETLQDDLRQIEAQVTLIKQERAAVEALTGQVQIYARGLASGKMTISDQMAYFDALHERAENHDAGLLALEAQRRKLTHRLTKHQQELDQLRVAGKRQRYAVLIEVDADQACEMSLDLTYVVSGAGWAPLYDVRLIDTGESAGLEIGYLAQVTQQTGEDWIDVVMTLSTARPALAETGPELEVWYIGPVRARPMDVRKRASVATAPEMHSLDAAAEPIPVAMMEAEPVVATVERTGAAVTYRVPGSVTIPPDGAAHKATVARFELAPQISYVTAPRLVEAAYRRATAVNDTVYVLLPGAVNLFISGTFVGTTRIGLTPPGGDIELYLGTEDRVRVERKLGRREVDRRLIGGQRRLSYSYEVSLENLLPAEAQLTLHDQIPVARHEEIKVRLTSAEPDPSEQNDMGILTWELTLGSGEKRRLRFEFLVEHPRDLELVGLL